MSPWNRIAGLATLLALLPGLLCGCFETATFTRTLTQTVAYAPGAPVRVVTENGSVSIRESDREDIEIVAHVRALSDERAETTSIRAERNANGLLSVRAQWPNDKRRDSEGCSFDILLPGAEGVDIETSNGRVETAGLAGNAKLHSSNGAIEVRRHEGPVTASTSNGSIALSDISGPVDVRSSNGRIDVKRASGEVKVRTSNGHIEVDLAPSSPGPVQATTSNGSVTLGIGPAFAGTLELETSNGALRADALRGATLISSDKNRLTVQFGDADQASQLHTSNGSIELKLVSDSK